MAKEFLQRNTSRHSKLGKNRKKKQRWRKPTGRDNKMREHRKGYPKVVKIGYKGTGKTKPVIVSSLAALSKLEKGNVAYLGKMGKKKKLEVAKAAKEKGIVFENFNPKKFMKNLRPKEAKK